MATTKKVPSPITILMVVIIIAAITSWLVPTGCYNTLFIGVMTKMERHNIGAEHSDKRTRLRNCKYVFNCKQISG